VTTEIRIPSLGESVTEAVIARWFKADGDLVRVDEPVLEIETEKAAMELAAEASGRLEIVTPVGSRASVGAVVGRIVAAPAPAARPPAPEPASRPQEPSPEPRVAAPLPSKPREVAPPRPPDVPVTAPAAAGATAPEVRPQPEPPAERAKPTEPRHQRVVEPDTERVPMTEIRRTIAARLVEAQRSAAILTTFNEVDVSALRAVRARYRERFKARHGVDLGFVSLFARATIVALGDFAVVNARIDGSDVVYHRRVHLGIAVATTRGLVVPVVRNADALTIAELERAIGELAERARQAKLAPDDLAGGTFSITNGGVFGSLLSTPLLNPPQSGILGMHRIQDRPVAVDGAVVIRPMMYVALSYDHRLVDGEQAVRFLVRIKEQLEDPARMLLDV
jgi:2-oxoglutarate dehydrogenase E2 component (dihydrolipoamide succinyltransferase)